MTKFLKQSTLAFAGLMLTGLCAQAQNSFHAPSDLVLTFQNPGGTVGSTQTVTFALGNVSTFFRDATPNTTFSLGNIGSTLSTTFGATWYDQSTLWMGAIGFRGTSDSTFTLLDGDPHQTLYFTKTYQAPAPTTILNSGTGIVGGMGQVKGRIEASGTSAVFVESTSTSFIDQNNPFTAPGVQNTAYTNIANGVQDNFGAGNFVINGDTVELGLDLFRLQNRNNVTGQNSFGQPTNIGQLLGTITIAQNGDVAFSSVPEPTTATMLGIAGFGLLLRRRIRAKRA